MMIKLKNLSKTFGRKVVFENINFEFDDVGLYLIKGESGRGKTTLLRIIAGLDTSYKGEVKKTDKCSVSFMFQEYRLFPNLSALENISVMLNEKPDADQIAYTALIDLGFNDEETRFYPSQLSGGMKQRVALARALKFDSSLLILDEPTKELDPALKNKVFEIIKAESEKRLVILVTHDELPSFICPKASIVL